MAGRTQTSHARLMPYAIHTTVMVLILIINLISISIASTIQLQYQNLMSRKNPKMATIVSLRTKILQLRNQLENLQKVEIQISPAKSPKHLQTESSKERLAIYNSKKRSTNPQFPIKVCIRSKSKDHIPYKYSSMKIDAPTQTKNFRKDKSRRKNTLKLDLSNLFPAQKASANANRYETMFLPSVSRSPSQSRTHSNSSFSRQSTRKFLRFDEDEELETPRFQRKQSIKTYKFPSSNPILNPPEEKVPSRKMFAFKNQSPSNIYINHSGSNPNMFFSAQNYQLHLSSKNKPSRKNLSQFIADTLQPQSTKSKRSKGSQEKRHYSRHFNQTAGSLIYYC